MVALSNTLHYEIWKYHKSTGRAHAKVLHNLTVTGQTEILCLLIGPCQLEHAAGVLHTGDREGPAFPGPHGLMASVACRL